MLATVTEPGLIVGVTLAGLCYGAFWTLIPVVAADMFGLKSLGANYKVSTIGEAAGYLLLGRLLTSKLYQSAISDHSSTHCYGARCFRYTFLIGSGFCASAVVASLVLSRRPLSMRSTEYFTVAHSTRKCDN